MVLRLYFSDDQSLNPTVNRRCKGCYRVIVRSDPITITLLVADILGTSSDELSCPEKRASFITFF